MQDTQDQPIVSIDHVVTRGAFVARRIADNLAWGEGAIQPVASQASNDAQDSLIDAVLDSIETVSEGETQYSSCTDGRLPVQLLDGEKVPVREQVVGADTVSAFYVAESLGDRFYKNADAPVAERVADVVAFLQENNLLPSTHIACGAAGGFTAITENVVRFSQNPLYEQRLRELLPAGAFDPELHQEMLQGNIARLQSGVYGGLSAETFVQAVENASGQRAVAELKDDGRGVHGHLEEAIVRVRVPGEAINGAALAAATDGRQVFGVNDMRMDSLACLFSRGNDQDYKIATMALEDFASSGHATLAKDLPTYIVTAA